VNIDQWERKITKDFKHFGIPENVIGREFLFVAETESDGFVMRGTVTGVRYTDRPFLEVSVRNLTAGIPLIGLYPNENGETTGKMWTAIGAGVHHQFFPGQLRFL
jgi:hypothetical protein